MKQQQVNIGIDLGGTNIKGVVINSEGEVLASQSRVTYNDRPCPDEKSSELFADTIRIMVHEFDQDYNAVNHIGIAAPGLADCKNTMIATMPGRLHGLENLQWSALLGKETISVINDAHAALVAECKAGAAQGYNHVLMLTLGTGVGGALMINGQLYQGFLQRAGHIGHMSLNTNAANGILNLPGTLEEVFGNAGVARRTSGRFPDTKNLVDAYISGDTLATFFWLDAVNKLAIAIASLINIVSPELIVIGGGIAKAGKYLMDPLNTFLNLYEWTPGDVKTKTCLAKYDEYSGAIGAAFWAGNKYMNS